MKKIENIVKRFPADSRISKLGEEIRLTFLTDKKIDAELYAYFQSKSFPQTNFEGKKETFVKFSDIDTIKSICSLLGIKSRQTYYNHLKYLKEQNFLIETQTGYILNNPEDFFFDIPLDTLQFLLDVVKEPVIKTYIYLGHQLENCKYKGESTYVFTIQEIGDHIGVNLRNNNQRDFLKINNYLDALENHGLIQYEEFYKNNLPYKKLIKVEKTRKNLKEPKKVV